jgi:type III secretory pathway component EscS
VSNFREAWVAEVFTHFKNEETLLPPLPVAVKSIAGLLTGLLQALLRIRN